MWRSRNLLSSKRLTGIFIRHFTRGDNWHNFDVESGNLGYGWIHYGLIQNLKPSRVLVIGSRYGFVPAVCALACRDNQRGVVDFVDAGYDYRQPQERDRAWGGVGFWKKTDIKKHFGKFELSNYLRVYVTTSKDFHQTYPKYRWQYVFIDGDHSYRGVKTDFTLFWPRLETDGILAVHDILTPNSIIGTKAGVKKFWKELKSSRKNGVIEISGLCGLGLIQK